MLDIAEGNLTPITTNRINNKTTSDISSKNTTNQKEEESPSKSENPKSISKLSYINKDWSVVQIDNIDDKIIYKLL